MRLALTTPGDVWTSPRNSLCSPGPWTPPPGLGLLPASLSQVVSSLVPGGAPGGKNKTVIKPHFLRPTGLWSSGSEFLGEISAHANFQIFWPNQCRFRDRFWFYPPGGPQGVESYLAFFQLKAQVGLTPGILGIEFSIQNCQVLTLFFHFV